MILDKSSPKLVGEKCIIEPQISSEKDKFLFTSGILYENIYHNNRQQRYKIILEFKYHNQKTKIIISLKSIGFDLKTNQTSESRLILNDDFVTFDPNIFKSVKGVFFFTYVKAHQTVNLFENGLKRSVKSKKKQKLLLGTRINVSLFIQPRHKKWWEKLLFFDR